MIVSSGWESNKLGNQSSRRDMLLYARSDPVNRPNGRA